MSYRNKKRSYFFLVLLFIVASIVSADKAYAYQNDPDTSVALNVAFFAALTLAVWSLRNWKKTAL